MGLRTQSFQITYDTSEPGTDPVVDFLEPCLENSVTYDRLSGYFSSKVLALAAKGLGKFIHNSGKMRLVMSSQLSATDFAFLNENLNNPAKWSALFDGLDLSSASLENILARKHFEAMCWLLAQGRLEIRIVVFNSENDQTNSPIFHPKIGIFRDSHGDEISFSGSINETAAGWTGNVEEFKVFKSWEETHLFVEQDKRTFERHWEGSPDSNFRTISLPDAIRQKLISVAPVEPPELEAQSAKTKTEKAKISFRDYQIQAIEAWDRNGRVGILEMATGTGKTKTAKGCIDLVTGRLNSEYGDKKSLVIVTAPFEHIAKQWVEELKEYSPILASSSNSWESDIRQAKNRLLLKKQAAIVIIAVQKTAAGKKFIEVILEIQENFDQRLFVGDEAHGLGATSYQSALLPQYEFRLGLSATPTRYFDEVGTDFLLNYFKQTVFEFNTRAAMNWRDPVTGKKALCPYKYYPEFVGLSPSESEDYEALSESIRKLQGDDLDKSQQKLLESLLFKRAAIVKTAESKIPALRLLLTEVAEDINYTLIYCHDLNQLNEVGKVLFDLGISYQKITGEESNSPASAFGGLSQRDWIIQQFSQGITRVLLAIKCLDEGVDIPAARIGFILASSGNPREFIQRRGRLLRPSESKEFALVHDFVVAPSATGSTESSVEKTVFNKELGRIREFASEALNFDEVELKVARVIAKMGV